MPANTKKTARVGIAHHLKGLRIIICFAKYFVSSVGYRGPNAMNHIQIAPLGADRGRCTP
jgi:hypothetical protein